MALTDNLIAYWKFDESSGNAADVLGGYTLTATNISYVSSKINNGADSNGSTSDLITTFIDPDSYNSGFSFGGWVWFDATNANVISWDESGSWGGVEIGAGAGTWGYRFGTGSPSNAYGTGVAISTGQWYHVIATHSATTDRLYVNGSQIHTATSGTLANTNTSFHIAGNSNFRGETLDGKVDEMGVWGRELSSTEVTSLYNSGSGLTYPFVIPAASPGIFMGCNF